MQQKNPPRRSVVSFIIASVCILAYIAALAYAAVKIYVSIDGYRGIAEQEFFKLADLASAAGVLGFMNEPFQEAVQDTLHKSKTLEGIIISGPNEEYAFERAADRAIAWNGDIPRFKSRPGVSGEPFHMPLRIEGQRNVTISAIYNYLDYEQLTRVLKFTLLVVLSALSLAFFTLMLEFLLGKNRAQPGAARNDPEEKPSPDFDEFANFETASPGVSGEEQDFSALEETLPGTGQFEAAPEDPRGLYTPRGNIGWEAYTQDRLSSEIHRCASFEQDLVFFVMELKIPDVPDTLYRRFADEAVDFFILRDLIFEKGEKGIAVISPNMDLDQGFAKSEEFHNRLLQSLPEFLTGRSDLCIGLSSRSGRLIDAERLQFEASQALRRALKDPVSPIVAFKSDPEKYRAFIASQNNQHP
ncbi:MAG: hypothetical protein LBT95_00155 [Treponema sp.]|jgi:hypothetical protein|nr:hypothetical protein [Treponema sp.]